MRLCIAQDPAAAELLSRDPLALVVGMLLDQQFAMEGAFAAPRLLADRLGVDALSAADIAAADPEQFAKIFQGPPALHRYPASMASRTQEVCRLLVDRCGGCADGLWTDVPDGTTLLKRVGELPGFGAQKSKIFVALLGQQYGVTPTGWREAAGDHGQEGSRRSVADVTGPDTLAEVWRWKQALKAAAKKKAAASAFDARPAHRNLARFPVQKSSPRNGSTKCLATPPDAGHFCSDFGAVRSEPSHRCAAAGCGAPQFALNCGAPASGEATD
ncbi:HhH-GPD-type base excision DNA repair protein [Geodermatophilus sp. URMC 62]|uniref:HhH-GPD-type base excision DNA repair protein n=1 Tax=Geodermatophilus sp. URMC 62 TaxID=3423414 RepID=UPI00406C664A